MINLFKNQKNVVNITWFITFKSFSGTSQVKAKKIGVPAKANKTTRQTGSEPTLNGYPMISENLSFCDIRWRPKCRYVAKRQSRYVQWVSHKKCPPVLKYKTLSCFIDSRAEHMQAELGDSRLYVNANFMVHVFSNQFISKKHSTNFDGCFWFQLKKKNFGRVFFCYNF